MTTPSYPPVMPRRGDGAGQLQTLRLMVGALVAAPVLLAVVATMVLHQDGDVADNLALFALPIAFSVAGVVVAPMLGRRALVGASSGSGREQAMAFQAATVLRFAVIEAGAILAFATGFVVQSPVPVWICAPIVVLGMIAFVFPSANVVRRADDAMNAAGGKGRLSEHFGTGI